jgi:hypothetical protein
MKKTILTTLLTVIVTISAHAQGTIAFDNQFNTNLTAGAASQGAVFDPVGNLNTGNFNLELWGGPSAGNLTLIARLLQSDGSIASGNAIGAPGQWIDVTGQSYVVPGVAVLGTGFFQVDGWIGSFNSFAAAIFGGAPLTGQSAIFQNATGGGAVTAPDLTGMPSFSISFIPEPTTLALCGLGAASLLLFRRKK